MKLKITLVLALCFALAPAVFAANTLKGRPAPDFSASKFINPPADGRTSLAQCKGEVVLVKLWGTHCGPCLRSMPEVQGLWNKFEGKGLHVFMSERQNSSVDAIQKIFSGKGLTFPDVIEGNMGGFPGVGRIPYAYVIGVDGNVIFEGSTGYGAVIEQEIEKIKYLGLGKNDVAPGLEKAASAFSAKDYAKARDEAAREKEKHSDDAGVVADADYIINKVDELVKQLFADVDTAKSKRRYQDAVAILERLSGKEFHGIEAADKAKDDLKDLKKDKQVKVELKAWDALDRTLKANERTDNKDAQRANLEKFVKHYEGTAAAEEAANKLSALGE